MLRSADWWLFTDTSGQPICPIFKVPAVCLTSQDWTSGLSQNVGK